MCATGKKSSPKEILLRADILIVQKIKLDILKQHSESLPTRSSLFTEILRTK